MKENAKSKIYNLTLSSVFIALATALSFIKVFNLPLGGSITLLSMLPIVMISCMLGIKWGLGSAFVYSLIQLFFGITMDGIFAWGLTPVMLIGTIVLDYLLAFSVLGIAGVFSKKGFVGIFMGTVLALGLRFLSHVISGYVIFTQLEQFQLFGKMFVNRPVLYSLAYNGSFMLPEIVITSVAVAILFRIPKIKKMILG